MSDEQVPGAPPPEELAPDAGDEQRQGLSPRHQRIAKLLRDLATTARAFTLYDIRNEAIQKFLSGLLDGFAGALAAETEIDLLVRPFEIEFAGEVVHLNRDRERSLAFRLYRDGVRGLKFRQGFGWEELSRLLEVLAVRYSGVHQHEDDMVTLLWKANFQSLEISAVEGFVAEDDASSAEPEPEIAPPEQDLPESLPRPSTANPEKLAWPVIEEADLQRLRAEAGASALPDDCLALAGRIGELLTDPKEQVPLAEVRHALEEVRDFLLSAEHATHLLRFIALLRDLAERAAPAWDQERTTVWETEHSTAFEEFLHTCGDFRAVRRLLHSVPATERHLHPELVQVLDAACPDPLGVVSAVLAVERGMGSRAISRQLLEHYGSGHLEKLRQSFQEANPGVAADVLRVIAHMEGEQAVATLAQFAGHADSEVQQEALWHLERMTYTTGVARALFDAFRRGQPAVRLHLLDLMRKKRDRRFADLLVRFVEEHPKQLGLDEAADIGRTVAVLGGGTAWPRLLLALKPSGLVRKTLSAPPAVLVMAGAAAGEMPAAEAEGALQGAIGAAGADVRPWIEEALARRRGEGGA
jgi:hypothetical protein